MPTYVKLGCWKDHIPRTLFNLEPVISVIEGPYTDREGLAISTCFRYARKGSYNIFALQEGGQCWVSYRDDNSYMRYGRSSSKCPDNGYGGPMANEVYEVVGGDGSYFKNQTMLK